MKFIIFSFQYILAFLFSLSNLSAFEITQENQIQRSSATSQELGFINKSVEITAEDLSIDQNNKTASFVGNVVAKQIDVVIRADKMVAYYETEINKVSKIQLYNNIIITKLDQIIKGEFGTYDIANNVIEMNDNVTLVKADNMLKGSYLFYDLNSNQVKIFNKNNKTDRIKAIFTPKKSS